MEVSLFGCFVKEETYGAGRFSVTWQRNKSDSWCMAVKIERKREVVLFVSGAGWRIVHWLDRDRGLEIRAGPGFERKIRSISRLLFCCFVDKK